ncbi:uncharacterized protein LOC130623959 [Hydractinia symbiolongicarpus]|uniref:uncharacterized protein LOC130623959 n=1 Tax=Hydractinia symbiolongicarpus TaxID=13093 RepID=UPI00254FF9D8|nr:uncharacterized protein LOC130623959 [Hydractinia symbiolongicarpus]
MDAGAYQSWKKKRKNTFAAYSIQYFAVGFERSATRATLWIYLTNLIKAKNPELFFGLISLMYFVPPILFSMAIARLADRTRNIKLIILLCNFISMTGCIIYVIPISPYYPLIGQTLLGVNSIIRPITRAEIARSYPADKMKKKTPVLMAFFFVGFASGPVIVQFIQHVDLTLFGLRITMGNLTGILSFLCIVVTQILVIFLASDLSKEYDLKEATGNGKYKLITYEKETFLHVLKNVLKTFDVLVVMIMTMVAAFFQIAFVASFPIISSLLYFPHYFVTIFYILFAAIVFVIIAVLTSTKLQKRTIYMSGLISLIVVLIAGVIQAALIKGQLNTFSNITLTILLAIAVTIAEIGEQIFLVIVASSFVSSKHQAYVESIRVTLRQVGFILGSLVSGYLVYYSYAFLIFTAVMCSIQLLIIILRRKTFENPEIVI